MANDKNTVEYTSLNFDDIKEKLIEYISADKTFNSANFQGSGLNIITDILAYVTHMTAVTANLSANEMFMDSAQIRQSIVSKAKELGYCPTSLRVPRARIKVSFKDINPNREYVFIPKGTRFATKYNTVFSTYQDIIAYAESTDKQTGEITFSAEFDIYEGMLNKFVYVVDIANEDQRFYVNSDKADLSTLMVQVQYANTSKIDTFQLNDNINILTPESLVFFLHQNPNNIYEVTFGDGVLGKKINHEDRIILTYIVGNRGIEMNGVDYFDKAESIDGFSSYDIKLIEKAKDGYEQESGEDIRFRAPKMWKAQNRAVVKQDYEAVLLAEYPWIECVKVWNGKDNYPPEYGKVFISIKPKHIDLVPRSLKDHIAQNLIKKYNVVTVIPEIVDPEFLYIGLKTRVKFKQLSTTRSSSNIEDSITNRILSYFTSNVSKFEYSFYLSPLTAIIDETDQSIVASESNLFLSKRIFPLIRSEERFSGSFNNELKPGTFESSTFNDGTEGIFLPSRLKDDGQGNINVVIGDNSAEMGKILLPKVGKIDYTTGEYQFLITCYELPKRGSVILYTECKDIDIMQKMNQIIYPDKNLFDQKWGVRSGVTITMIPIDISQKY